MRQGTTALFALLGSVVACGGVSGSAEMSGSASGTEEGGPVGFQVSCSEAKPTQLPLAALEVPYLGTTVVHNGNGECDPISGACAGYSFSATGLPVDVQIDQSTGVLSGVVDQVGSYPVVITATELTGEQRVATTECEFVVNPALSGRAVLDTPKHCVDVGEDLLSFLSGGDGSPITCALPAADPSAPTCPHGPGNGSFPAGITSDYVTGGCSHSGAVSEDARGTWVWAVEVRQSGRTTYIPACASSTTAQAHDITVSQSGVSGTDGIEPVVLDLSLNPAGFGGDGDPSFVALGGDLCANGGCTYFGLAYDVTCSGLSSPYGIEPLQQTQDMMGNDSGFSHGLSAGLSTVVLEDRPWVANWTLDYCNSGEVGPCMGDNISQNAQSRLNYAVVAWPAD